MTRIKQESTESSPENKTEVKLLEKDKESSVKKLVDPTPLDYKTSQPAKFSNPILSCRLFAKVESLTRLHPLHLVTTMAMTMVKAQLLTLA